MNDKTRVALELFVLSFMALFVELLIIRWMSADIRAFTIFRTFPLITCFVGLGVGFSLGSDKLFKLSTLGILALVFVMKSAEATGINLLRFISSDAWTIQDINFSSMDPKIVALQILVLLILLAGPFLVCVCIGSRLGVLFGQMKALNAYCLDLAGSIAGSLAFAFLSSLGISPATLLLIPTLVISIFICTTRKSTIEAIAVVLAIGVTFMWNVPDTERQFIQAFQPYVQARQRFWSPYYEVDLRPYMQETDGKKETFGLEVSVNHRHQQYYFRDDFPVTGLSPDAAKLLLDRREYYRMPFVLKSPRSVLILGAGTGQNIKAALDSGAQSIDAVDIDPLVLQIGKQYNTNYSNNLVHQICDDARHFIRSTHNKYDLIIFPILDSQTTVGQGSSVRTDSYVYTTGCFEQALKLLNPDGLIVLIYGEKMHWLEDRLRRSLVIAAGYEPMSIDKVGTAWGNACIFLLGDAVKEQRIKLAPGWMPETISPVPGNKPLTDDWPYLYLAPNFVDIPYWMVVSAILLLGTFLGRKLLFGKSEAHNWQMFFLGAAFLLLELHAISLLSLIYGSTWMTSATVINGILVMIMLANLFVLKFQKSLDGKQPIVYGVLIASILASYLMPGKDVLAALPDLAGTAVVTLVTLLPMCVAGVLFATAFSVTKNASRAMAFNLLGAVIGGVLEYLSNFWGIKSLELIAAGLYAISFVCICSDKTTVE